MIEQLAVVLYGMLTLTLGFTFAMQQGSALGMVLIVLAAAVTYVFQSAQLLIDNVAALCSLWALVVLLFVAGLAVSFGVI